jgi:dTDP-4-amino-4,6-dideoxygalactose transaminase
MTDRSETPVSGDSKKPVFPKWPVHEDDELRAVEQVLASGQVNYWTGREGVRFEQEFVDYLGVKHAVAVSNGSVALGLALRTLDLNNGAEVIVTPRTFIASVSEIILAGGVPVFADIDPESQNISAQTIEPLIGPRTEAIMTVHLAGWPCDMPAINELATAHGLAVIEDCAQAHGATIGEKKVGGWGDVAAFSFCQDKIMSTGGEGGMLVTNDQETWSRCWSFKDHGKSPELMTAQPSGNAFRWVHGSIGTNGRMTEVQAAIGRCQLGKLDGWLDRRRANVHRLNACLGDISALRTTIPPKDIGHAYYKYYCFIRPEALKDSWSRDRILSELAREGIPAGSGACPEVYLEAAFSESGCRPERRLPAAQELGETSIMLPVHPPMSEIHMQQMADAFSRVMSSATR